MNGANNREVLTDENEDVMIPPPVDSSVEPVVSSLKESSDTKTIFRNLSGIMYTLIASFLFTCTTFVIKQLHVGLFDVLLLRFILQTIAVAIFLFYKKYKLFSGTRKQLLLQFFRGLAGTGSFLGFFLSYSYIPLPDVATLSYTRVIWTVLLSMIVYHDKPSIVILLAIPLTILGVTFIAQPSFIFQSLSSNITLNANTTLSVSLKDRYIGFTIALGSALAASANVIMFKQLLNCNVKSSVQMFQYTVLCTFALILNQLFRYFIEHKILLIFNWQYALASFMCIIQTVSSILGQTGMKREHASIYTITTSADILFAIILQNLFTTLKSNIFALLGSTLVISSVILIGGHKLFKEKCQKKKPFIVSNGKLIEKEDPEPPV